MIEIRRYKSRKYYLVGNGEYISLPEIYKLSQIYKVVNITDYNGIDITEITLLKGKAELLKSKLKEN
jgi:hypothetical protein